MDITYALVDNDGQLHTRTGDWEAELGPEGWARIQLTAAPDLSGFVNDCGLLNQDAYPRNVVGSVLLVCHGAGVQPYAGPVVITGWDPTPSDTSEIRPLDERRIDHLRVLHARVRGALDPDAGEHDLPAETVAALRQLAELVRTAPTPQMTFGPFGGAR